MSVSCKTTTKKPISNDSTSDDSPNTSFNEENFSKGLSFVIDVRPKRKVFHNIEERILFEKDYERKKKTEICKNWELTGRCPYKNKCSFAHGKSELQEKVHLNKNYKSKPCDRFFLEGKCNYGYRCQYLHNEIKKDVRFREYLRKSDLKLEISQGKKGCYESNLSKFINFYMLEKNGKLEDFFQVGLRSSKLAKFFA